MASEIRVNKIENRSGLGTVTFADTGVDLAGIVTATTFSGSGASLTALPAAQVTGTLPAISGANLTALNGSNIASGAVADARISTLTASKLTGALPALDGSALTGVASTENIRTNTNATFLQNVNVSGSTTTGTAVVGGGVTISESGIEASGIGITCANINGGQIAGRRNIAINGAMQVAQRGTVTGITNNASSYGGPDRFKTTVINHGTYTTSQESDAPTGFTKSLKVDNTSQDSSLASNARLYLQHKIEKQDLIQLKKGTSAAKQLTVQFYVKSNKTGTYILELFDNINNRHVSSTYTISSSATWEQKIITFPADTGGSAYDGSNPTNTGIEFNWWLAAGSNFTSGSLATTWTGNSDTQRVAGITVNVGNSGYWQITGVQIEAGAHATAFEHRPHGDELALCQRYYYRHVTGNSKGISENATQYNSTVVFLSIPLPTEMRTEPSLDITNSSNHFIKYANNGSVTFDTLSRDGITTKRLLCVNASANGDNGHACMIRTNSADAYIAADAEL